MPFVEIKKLKDGFFSDPKTGWSSYPFMFGFGGREVDIRGVHVVSIYPGQVRGNHYHEKTNEFLYIFAGNGEFIWEEDGGLKSHIVHGTPTVITIPPGIKHAFRNLGEDIVYLLAVRDGEFDPKNPDIVRTEPII